jgi:hypothetical protein
MPKTAVLRRLPQPLFNNYGVAGKNAVERTCHESAIPMGIYRGGFKRGAREHAAPTQDGSWSKETSRLGSDS